MSEVKRYDPMGYDRLSGYMQQHPEGDYVRHADYAALEAEHENLRLSWGLLRSENNALRQQRDKLAGLLYEASGELRTDRHHGLRPRINAALAEVEKAR